MWMRGVMRWFFLFLALSSGFWLYKTSSPSSPALAKTDENYTQAATIFTPEVRELVSRTAKNQLGKNMNPCF